MIYGKEEKGSKAAHSNSGVTISATYASAPRYRIVVAAENFKVAEKSMNDSVEKIRSALEKLHGAISFTREESKKSLEAG